MITLLYSTLATPSHPFSDATMLVTDDGFYLLTIPTFEEWTHASIQINDYPAVDVEIHNQIIEIEGQFVQPEEELWVKIDIATATSFGGAYQFPLASVPMPTAMPQFTAELAHPVQREHSFWWRTPRDEPYTFFWERYHVSFNFKPNPR